jgi:hypothetical protein
MSDNEINVLLEQLEEAAEHEVHSPHTSVTDPDLLLDAASMIDRLQKRIADLEARNANLHNELSRARAMEASDRWRSTSGPIALPARARRISSFYDEGDRRDA